jgi:hypothetical protein
MRILSYPAIYNISVYGPHQCLHEYIMPWNSSQRVEDDQREHARRWLVTTARRAHNLHLTTRRNAMQAIFNSPHLLYNTPPSTLLPPLAKMAPFDLDACIEKLKKKQLLGEALLREICEKTKEVLMRESNVVHVSSPVTVVGDIHGQFHDLIEIFRIGGAPPDTNYLFLGMSPQLNNVKLD